MRARLLLAGLIAASPLAARATPDVDGAPPAAEQKVDPQAEAAARELIGLMHLRQMLQDGMAPSLAAMRAGTAISHMLDANPEIRMERAKNPAAWDAALRKIGEMQATLTEQTITDIEPEMEAMTVRTYAANFSVAELREIIAFYRKPIGQKIITRMPAVMSSAMQFVQEEIPKRMVPKMAAMQPEIQKTLAPLLPKHP